MRFDEKATKFYGSTEPLPPSEHAMNEVSNVPVPRQRGHRWFAALYDSMSKLDEKKAQPLRQVIAGSARGHVLEIGCGTGLNLAEYNWQDIAWLEATEPDPFMLQRSRSKGAALPVDARSKVRFQQAPAELLPFDNATFDTAVATLVLCSVRDLDQALSEIWRVLKPGGELLLLEHVAADGLTRRIQKVIQPMYGWMAAGCQLTRDTEAAVRRAGFDLVVTERTSFGPLCPAFLGVAKRLQS